MKGKVFIISGASGTGKSTLVHQVLQARPDIFFSVSATTRPPRPGERDGVEYHFLREEDFARLLGENGLLEHAEYVGNHYGTPAAPVREAMEKGQDSLLDIEVQGARQVKACLPEAVSIFIIPPSFGELERRLRSRSTDSEEKILGRLARAKEEYAQAREYDYIVVNDTVPQAVSEILAILTAEKCRSADRKNLIEEVL